MPSPLDVLCPEKSEESMYGDYWNNTDVNGVTNGSQWHDTDMNTYTNLRTHEQLMHYTSAFFTHTHIMNLSLTNKVCIIGACTRVYQQVACEWHCTCRHSGTVTGSSAIKGTVASITEVSVPFD